MFWWVIWWHDGQSKRPLRQDKHGHYFLISHLLFVLQYFYHNFESCCWTIYTNRKIILHDVFVQLQSIFNSTNINHGQFYPIFGFWLKFYYRTFYLIEYNTSYKLMKSLRNCYIVECTSRGRAAILLCRGLRPIRKFRIGRWRPLPTP